jgi:hypothetical protein
MKSDTLAVGEFHPQAHAAFSYIRSTMSPMLLEAIASCALSGNRSAELAMGTWSRIKKGEAVSDRYLLGMAWFLREINEVKDEQKI